MSGWTETRRYECHSGCSIGGCPGHDATLIYHGSSDVYEWIDGYTNRHYFDLNELRTFLDIVTPYFEEGVG